MFLFVYCVACLMYVVCFIDSVSSLYVLILMPVFYHATFNVKHVEFRCDEMFNVTTIASVTFSHLYFLSCLTVSYTHNHTRFFFCREICWCKTPAKWCSVTLERCSRSHSWCAQNKRSLFSWHNSSTRHFVPERIKQSVPKARVCGCVFTCVYNAVNKQRCWFLQWWCKCSHVGLSLVGITAFSNNKANTSLVSSRPVHLKSDCAHRTNKWQIMPCTPTLSTQLYSPSLFCTPPNTDICPPLQPQVCSPAPYDKSPH